MSWTRGRPPGHTVPVLIQQRVYRINGRGCYLCDRPAEQIDHVIPWAEGGSNDIENLRPICTACHEQKSRAESVRGTKRRNAKRKRSAEQHPSEVDTSGE